MTATTFDSQKQLRRQYAIYTLEELQGMKSADLRRMASEIGVKNYDRNGQKRNIWGATKLEAADLIYQACADERLLLQVKTELDDEQLARLEGMAVEADQQGESDEGAVALTTWMVLRDYAIGLWIPEEQTWRAVNGTLNELALRLSTRLLGEGNSIYTVLNRKTTILKLIRAMLDNERQNPYFPALEDVFNRFRDTVNKSLSYLQREKNDTYKAKVSKSRHHLYQVKVAQLYNKAIDVLTNLQPTDKKTLWGDVAYALFLVTGRRLSEVFCTAQFAPTDDPYKVVFSGQLKTKGRDGGDQPYEIPTLVLSELVINALAWLREKDKVEETPEKAHKRFSRQIVNYTDVWNGLYVIDEAPEETSDKWEKLTPHLCRAIYGQVMATRKPKTMKEEAYMASILGHGIDDVNTVQSYNAGINILDADEVWIAARGL